MLYVLVPGGAAAAGGQAADRSGAGAAHGSHHGHHAGGNSTSTATTAPATTAASDPGTASRSTSVGGTTPLWGSKSMLTRANVAAQDMMVSSEPPSTGPGTLGINTETFSLVSGLSRGPSERLSSADVGADESSPDLRSRIEALANFKTFMQVREGLFGGAGGGGSCSHGERSVLSMNVKYGRPVGTAEAGGRSWSR